MKVSIDPTLFEWKSESLSRLKGSQCLRCDTVQFPQKINCEACYFDEFKLIELDSIGTLWSWTTQNYPPNSPPYKIAPADFEPFNLGYVELANKVRVQSRILAQASELEIGMPLQLTFEPLFVNEENQEVMMYAFEPIKPPIKSAAGVT